jgi:hypothetical protein
MTDLLEDFLPRAKGGEAPMYGTPWSKTCAAEVSKKIL